MTAPGFAERFVSTAVDEFNGLDIIINNAGYVWDNVIQKMTDEQWYAMIDVHLTAPFRILRAAQPIIRRLVKKGAAVGQRVVRKVVNISSVAGLFGNAGQTGYSAGKAGILGVTQTLAKEWGRMNVTVNCVAFGLIQTRLVVSTEDNVTARIDGRDIMVGVNADLSTLCSKPSPWAALAHPKKSQARCTSFVSRNRTMSAGRRGCVPVG